MNGIVFDVFNHVPIRYYLFVFYLIFLVVDMLMYFILTKIFIVNNFDDRVILCHQMPMIFLIILGMFYPMFWYLSCLHLIAHFLAETLFLIHHNNYEYIVHHIYTILFLGQVVLFTPPFVCVMALVPLLNNVIHHCARVFDTNDKTRIFRHIFFVFSRIIYPMFMLMIVPFIEITFMMKISFFFFATTIVALMSPKLAPMIDTQSEISQKIYNGFDEIIKRLGLGN